MEMKKLYQNKRRIPLPLQVGDECEKNLTKEHVFYYNGYM